MLTHITFKDLKEFDYAYIKQIAACLRIKFSNQPKSKLTEEIINVLTHGNPRTDNFKPFADGFYVFGEELGQILRNEDINKSEKFRRLVDLADYDVLTIASLTGANYSFVYGVLQRYKRRVE